MINKLSKHALMLICTLGIMLAIISIQCHASSTTVNIIPDDGVGGNVSCTADVSLDSSGNVQYTYHISAGSWIVTRAYVDGSNNDDLFSSGSCTYTSQYNCVSYSVAGVRYDDDSITFSESGEIYVNKCGDSVIWYVRELANGKYKLTISGTGAMYDYATADEVPWKNIKSSITEIVVNSGVTSIGKSAFSDCESLTSITIPVGVTSIGNDAFFLCRSLTSITIPDSVTSIGDYAFAGCESLTSITIQSGVTSIGKSAFEGCSRLVSITIPDSVTSIRDYTFEHCSSLTSITIQSGVTSIGNGAFEDCTSLTSITIPDSVTSIGNGAFDVCNDLDTIRIGVTEGSVSGSPWGATNATVIWATAYGSCGGEGDGTNLKWVLYTDGLLEITGTGAMKNWSSRSEVPWNSYTSSIKQVTISYGATSIGNNAFYDCNSLTNIAIPDSVTSIGIWAFDGCRSLTSIAIPESVTSIGSDAFYHCTSLASITIPDSVTSIGDEAFVGCSKLTSITIPSGVTSIGNYTFSGCSSLTSITVPSGVTSIGAMAFYTCSSLTSIIIPSSVTSIGGSAFGGCTALTKVVIPEATTTISNGAFKTTTQLLFIADTVPSNIASSSLNYITGYTPYSSLINVDMSDKSYSFYPCKAIDDTNKLSVKKWAVGEQNTDYFKTRGTALTDGENSTLSVNPLTNVITLYSKDIVGNETVTVIDIRAVNRASLKITYGDKISDVDVSGLVKGSNSVDVDGSWSFSNGSTIPNAGTVTSNLTFTPALADDIRMGCLVRLNNTPVVVNKATPTVNSLPVASSLKYRQKLSESSLSGGRCDYSGTWSWTSPTTQPIAGHNSYSVTFTPTDTANVNSVTRQIYIDVAKYKLNVSNAKASEITYGQKLSDSVITLPN